MSDPKHPQWEYLILSHAGSTKQTEIFSIFTERGKQGWEYVGQLPTTDARFVHLIFKRLK